MGTLILSPSSIAEYSIIGVIARPSKRNRDKLSLARTASNAARHRSSSSWAASTRPVTSVQCPYVSGGSTSIARRAARRSAGARTGRWLPGGRGYSRMPDPKTAARCIARKQRRRSPPARPGRRPGLREQERRPNTLRHGPGVAAASTPHNCLRPVPRRRSFARRAPMVAALRSERDTPRRLQRVCV